MNRSLFPATILLLGASACAEFGAVDDELLVPDDLALHWDRSFNGEGDDRVALVPIDLMVYGALSGEPVADVQLTVEPDSSSVLVLPFEDVLPVDSADCDLVPCVWDAWRDRYVDVLDSPGEAPTWSTDRDGLVRAYLLIDAFPDAADSDFDAVSVLVSMGMTEASFQLVPQWP